MTNEPEPNTRAGEAQAHQLATALMGVDRFTADGNFHPDYLAMLTRPLPQPSELGTSWQSAVEETDRLERELDLTNDDHIALWLEANAISPPLTHQLGWVACRIAEAYEAQIAKLQADGDKLAGALEAFQRHYDLNDCDERCGALEVPISDLRRACQALGAKGDSRG